MIRNWNEGWLFYRGDDAPVPVCLPHDAMLLEPRDAKCRNGVNSGYFPGGKYTYEKHFQVSPEDLGQFIAVREGLSRRAVNMLFEKINTGHVIEQDYYADALGTEYSPRMR